MQIDGFWGPPNASQLHDLLEAHMSNGVSHMELSVVF